MPQTQSESQPVLSHLPRRLLLGLFLLSAATLAFEINLTRLFSVSQFYHFAFMIVSLALLGYGASGTTLAVFPTLGRKHPSQSFPWLALACGVCLLGAYLLTNWVPFDSFSIAWDRRQVGVLLLHYLVLALPFYFSGLATGLLLAVYPKVAAQTYAANLVGSAMGCALALVAPSLLAGEGTVVLACGLAILAAAASIEVTGGHLWETPRSPRFWQVTFLVLSCGLLIFCTVDMIARLSGRSISPFLQLRLSPYKGLSYALQYPDAALVSQRWNSFSRVDVVRSSVIRSVPGLSYRYMQPLPPEDGLLVDGDDLSPILHPGASLDFADYLPSAIAFRLRPAAEVLVLEPRGGLDILAALGGGAWRVTAVEVNPLIVAAAAHIYGHPAVRIVVDSDRSYTRRSKERYDVILVSLASSYHPVRSGAYSLAEDYRYTVEAFQDAIASLKPSGLMVVTRWLQTPPSEELRVFALAVAALERSGGSPETQLVALRGYNIATLLVKNDPFTSAELAAIREFAASRAFDLTWAPGLRLEESNQYNILPEPVYYEAFTELLKTKPREDFYRTYPYDVSPPSDDRPFFGHYFKWSQAGQVWAELGKTWQPFGGAGYFVVLALLALAVLLSLLLVLLPAFAARHHEKTSQLQELSRQPSPLPFLLYFACIGFAYLLVEMPLLQRFILFLGHPSHAMTAVLFTLLFFSGMGSQFSQRFPLAPALGILCMLLFGLPFLLPGFFNLTLGLPYGFRLALTISLLAPVGFLMGLPFPGGMRWLAGSERGVSLIPWVWGVNGAASVVSAVLAALLALSFGFGWVLRVGALCYAAAWVTVWLAGRQAPAAHPGR